MFLRFTFIREHYFWQGNDTKSNKISYVSLRIKNRTWNFKKINLIKPDKSEKVNIV